MLFITSPTPNQRRELSIEDLNSSRKLTRNSFKQCNFDENTNYANERSSVQYNEQWIPRTQQYNRYIPHRHHFLLEFGKRKSRLPLITLSTSRCTLYIVVVRGLLLETEGTCYYLECLYLPSIILMWLNCFYLYHILKSLLTLGFFSSPPPLSLWETRVGFINLISF